MSNIFVNPDLPGLDPEEDISDRINAVAIISIIVTFFVLVLRLTSRRLSHVSLWADDWLIIVASVFLWALCALTLYETHHLHVGQHIAKSSPESYKQLQKLFFPSGILLQNVYGITKLSVIAFFWRIFSHSIIRWPLIVLAVLVVLWNTAFTLVNIFWCKPVHAQWDYELQAYPGVKCVERQPEFLGNTISDLILDVCVLVLPLLAIRQLQLPRGKRIAVSCIFLLGVLTTISCGMRLWQNQVLLSVPGFDITFLFSNILVWAHVEAMLGILTACLPTLAPLVKVVRHGSLASASAKHTSGSSVHRERHARSAHSAEKPHLHGSQTDSRGGSHQDELHDKRDVEDCVEFAMLDSSRNGRGIYVMRTFEASNVDVPEEQAGHAS